jgi:hypothetical protein
MGVHIDSSEVRRLQIDLAQAPAEVRQKAPAAIKRTLYAIEGDGKVLAPVDTGALINSITTDVDADRLGGEVGPTVDYGDDVEYGTQPHIIRARPGGVLAFPGAGGTVFAREVHHPGTAPQPYMGPAFDRNIPQLERALGEAGESTV